jgi:hypothetical protein
MMSLERGVRAAGIRLIKVRDLGEGPRTTLCDAEGNAAQGRCDGGDARAGHLAIAAWPRILSLMAASIAGVWRTCRSGI